MTQSVPLSQREGVAPLQQRDYDGKFVVTHTVQQGQTLTKIAGIYLFPRWEPIWIYNTKVERVLGDDPNLIRKGVTIFIPRSKDGYDTLIKKLTALKYQAENNGDRLNYELEADWNNKEATKVLVDFVGSVATTLATVSLKAMSAAKLTAAAEKTAGHAKIAARLAARSEARDLATRFKNVRGRLLKTALSDQRALHNAKPELRKAIFGKGADAAATFVDSKNEGGPPLAKHAKNALKGGAAVRDFAKGALTGVAAIGEVADILLDYLEPSVVADGYLFLTRGETTQQSYEGARKQIEQAVATTSSMIDAKIEHYEEERALLYG
jgi:hypothetical protein